MFFKNKSVFATADYMEAEQDVKFLGEICRKVFYLPKYGFDNISAQSKFSSVANNIEILSGNLKEIYGTESVQSVLVDEKNIMCDGVFLLNKNLPPEKLIFGLEIEQNSIRINNMCETNIPGIFAAGDCTGWPLQLSKAIGQGQVAAQMASKFVSR